MLCKLSLKNISKSIKDYAIYFFTIVLGVAIFYVFNAIDDQTVMMNLSTSTSEVIKLMTNILSGVSVFVSFILAFLIIYASRFLIKRRNKEFGIYLTLGMSKRKISLVLFLETLSIGILSLGVGLGLGFLLSQLMSIVVANSFDANLTKFRFVFSKSACIKTLIYFSIMYFLVMIFNTISVSKCKLIDLINSSKTSEQVKLKNPYVCTIVFIISCITLGYAYYLVTGGVSQMSNVDKIFLPIGLGCISTFFIFWSLSGLLLKIFMSMKGVYYKGLNSFTLRQFSSKINTNVFSMTIICLMLFITICVLSSSLSMKIAMSNNLKKLAPADIQIGKFINVDDEYYNEEQVKDSGISIASTLENLGYDINSNLKDVVEVGIYRTDSVTLKDTIGSFYDIAKDKYPLMMYERLEKLVKISDYNKIAKLFNFAEQTLDNDEYLVVINYAEYKVFRSAGLKANTVLNINGKSYYPKYDNYIEGFIAMNATYSNMGFIVVPDDALLESQKEYAYLTANYNTESKDEKIKKEEELRKLCKENEATTVIDFDSKMTIHENSINLGAMVTFIGLYLGLIFLISCAAILALKELSESSDNVKKFQMLRKIGVDEKEINKALFKQIGIFFMFPLVIAIIHSIFGIKFCSFILSAFGGETLLSSISSVAIFIIIIYGGYFLMTYICSKNIIKDNR
mgnify:FL=1